VTHGHFLVLQPRRRASEGDTGNCPGEALMHRFFTLLALVAAVLLPTSAFAKKSKEVDPEDHENHFGEVDPVEVDDITIKFHDQHAQMEFIMVKAKVKNDADLFLFVEPRESKWIIDGEAEDAAQSKPKTVLIEPYKEKTITWKIKGDLDDGVDYHVEECTLQIEGFAVAPNEGEPIKGDDFQIPPSKNKFKAGPFDCKLDKMKNDTHYSKAAFNCTYKGENVGFIDASVAGWRIPSGQEFANEERGIEKKMLTKGKSHKFTVGADIDSKIFDMEEDGVWHLIWNDTFSESKKTPVKMGKVDFELDEDKTEEEND
jgi:hypothetical protein